MIAILTSPRAVDYFTATCRAVIEQSPASRVVVVADGCDVVVPPEWSVIHRTRTSHADAMWEAFRAAAAADEDLVFLEDDVRLARGALQYIESHRFPEHLAFVQFWNRWMGRAPWALYETSNMETLQGLLCVKFPSSTVRALAEVKPAKSDPELALRIALAGKRYGMHVPDLAWHVGETSTHGYRQTHQCANFPDDAFSAIENLKSAIALGYYG